MEYTYYIQVVWNNFQKTHLAQLSIHHQLDPHLLCFFSQSNIKSTRSTRAFLEPSSGQPTLLMKAMSCGFLCLSSHERRSTAPARLLSSSAKARSSSLALGVPEPCQS